MNNDASALLVAAALAGTLLFSSCTGPAPPPTMATTRHRPLPSEGGEQAALAQLFELEKRFAGQGPDYRTDPEYQRQFARLRPNPQLAIDTFPEVSKAGEGRLMVDYDNLISTDSFEGAVTVLFLNAQAQGKALDRMIEQLAELSPPAPARYLAHSSSRLWPRKGRYYLIPYAFAPDLPRVYRQATLEAMELWQQASQRKLFFLRVHPTQPPYLLIRKAKIGGGVVANATVGYQPRAELNFDVAAIEQAGLPPIFVALHELGHVLGLRHEHQRPDRNIYLKKADHSPLPPSSPFFQARYFWQQRQYTLPGNKVIQLQVPMTRTLRKQVLMSAQYDYLSVMHYAGFIAQRQQQGYRIGDAVRFSFQLSPLDRRGVQTLYP